MPKSQKVKLYVQAKSIEHKSVKLSHSPDGQATWYTVSDNVVKYMFDKLQPGDYVECTIPTDSKQPITFIEYANKETTTTVKPIDTFPTKEEEKILRDGWKEQAIIWQNMMAHAEKCMECAGDFGSDYENARRLLILTKTLFEASLEYLNTKKLPDWCKSE